MNINPTSLSSHSYDAPMQDPTLPTETWTQIGSFADTNTALAIRGVVPGLLTSKDYMHCAFSQDQINTLASSIIKKLAAQNPLPSNDLLPLETCRTIAPRVRALDLSNLTLTLELLDQLALLFPLVEKLTLSKAKVSNDVLTKLSIFQNIRDIDCSNCDLEDSSIAYLPLAQLQKLNVAGNPKITGSNFNLLPPSLTEFDCSSCSITNESLPFLTLLINLRKLNISHNKDVNPGYISPVPLPQSLIELDCSHCSLTDRATFLSHLTQLQKLKLGDNSRLTGWSFDQLPSSLLELDCLFENSFRCYLEDFAIQKIAHLIHLQKLAISGHRFLFTGIEFNHLPCSLVELQCQGTMLNDAAISKLSHLTNLQKLNVQYHAALTGTSYAHRPKTEIAITGSTFDHLPPSLRELNCGSCSLADQRIGLLHHLVNLQKLVISHNKEIRGSTFDLLPPSLKEFDCSHCCVTDDGIQRLAHLANLSQLRISNNKGVTAANRGITGATFNSLAQSIKELYCDGCAIDDIGISHLARLGNLEMLNAGYNYIRGSTLDRLPSSIRELNLKCCSTLKDEALGNFDLLTQLENLDISGGNLTGRTLHLLPARLNERNINCSLNPFVGTYFHNFFMSRRLK